MCVAAPSNATRAIQNFLCTQLQNDVGVRADKHASGCDIAKHTIEDGPVPSAFNGIDPHQNAVNPHELLSNGLAKIVVIYRRLKVNPPGVEGREQICKPAILGSCGVPCLTIAGRENCHSQLLILYHWRSLVLWNRSLVRVTIRKAASKTVNNGCWLFLFQCDFTTQLVEGKAEGQSRCKHPVRGRSADASSNACVDREIA